MSTLLSPLEKREMKKWVKPITPSEMLRKYPSTLKIVRKDFARPVENFVYCMDFATSHVHMHRWRSGFSQYELIDHILERATPEDKITIAPTHIYEFLHYLDRVATRIEKYKHYRILLSDNRIRKSKGFMDRVGSKPISMIELAS